MKFQDYYESQSGGELPFFKGRAYQRGYGLGNMFKSFYRWILPMVKTHALPLLQQGVNNVKSEALKTVANIATDTLNGKKFTDAAEERSKEAVTNLVSNAINKVQAGSGIKRKKKLKQSKKRFRDIFEKL